MCNSDINIGWRLSRNIVLHFFLIETIHAPAKHLWYCSQFFGNFLEEENQAINISNICDESVEWRFMQRRSERGGGWSKCEDQFQTIDWTQLQPSWYYLLAPPHRVLAKDPLLWTIAFATVSLPFSPFVLWLRQSHDTQLSIFWGRGRLGVARFIHSNQDKGLHSEKKFTLSKCANQNHVGFFSFKELFERADIPKEHIDHQKHLDICQRFCRPKINLGSWQHIFLRLFKQSFGKKWFFLTKNTFYHLWLSCDS